MGGIRTDRGFTLIELLVVVGVIAVLAGLAAPALGSLTGADVRSAAGELSGTMRALFDTAALRHARCRLTLDLRDRAWWADCGGGGAPAAGGGGAQVDDEELARLFPDERNATVRRLLATTRFGALSDRVVEKRELPGRTAFGKVHVDGQRDDVDGKMYVDFFPGGRAQRAFVPVVDGDNLYTVVVEPFTGRARVVVGPVEVRE